MPVDLELVHAEAMKLDPADRIRLLERLMGDLEPDLDGEQAWEREAARRDAEWEAGQVGVLDGPQTLQTIRAQLSS